MTDSSQQEPVRIAVVGVGHLGKIHARLLAPHPGARLVAVVDVRPDVVAEVARTHGVPGYTDYRDLVGAVEAVCVVVPTKQHREVAGFFLEHGVDVLVEKPIATDVRQGEELVALANQHRRILQVGHVERFNPAVQVMADLGVEARYVESQRLAPFSFRSTDIGVVMDLMIHDLDLVLAMMRAPIVGVEAFGGAVFTPQEDMASAIIRFEGGGVAHLTASRVALRPVRKLRVFSKDAYVGMDLTEAKATVIRRNPDRDVSEVDLSKIDGSRPEALWKLVFEGLLTVKELKLDERNALQDELSAFLGSVRTRLAPRVRGEEGCAALAAAERVVAAIARNRW